MEKNATRLGIISALQEEQTGLIAEMTQVQTVTRGMRDYVQGMLWGLECVCVLSRMGKVASSATAATLIERFGVTHLIFTGVAGSADPAVKVGDIVIADQLVQHDMDTRPLFPRFEIPLTGISRFPSDLELSTKLGRAADDFVSQDIYREISSENLQSFRLHQPRVHRGLIASGDEFIHSAERLRKLKLDFPDLLAVEMEGAAVAQVCFEFGLPFSVIRTISDGANEDSAVDFLAFIRHIASVYAFHTLRRFCDSLRQQAC